MSVRNSVLEALQNNEGNYVSGGKLSEDLGVSRAAVWKAISGLRQEGYRIDAVTNRGYLLLDREAVEKCPNVTEESVRRHLPARYKDNIIQVHDMADSTNLIARRIAAEGSKDTHGTIVVARRQTAGRGRLGRSFFSPAEGIYMSVIIKTDFDITRHTLVTVATAVAVAQAVDNVCGQNEETKIKWVNDIYLKGKKICGILTEGISDFESGRIEHLVVGIGINTSLDDFPEELKKTAGAVDGDWSRSQLIAEIATGVLDHVRAIQLQISEGWMDDRFFMRTYRDKSMLTGSSVQVYRGTYRQDPTKEIDGIPARVKGIDDEGGLMVIWEDGSEETLTTGEVTVRADSSNRR